MELCPFGGAFRALELEFLFWASYTRWHRIWELAKNYKKLEQGTASERDKIYLLDKINRVAQIRIFRKKT